MTVTAEEVTRGGVGGRISTDAVAWVANAATAYARTTA